MNVIRTSPRTVDYVASARRALLPGTMRAWTSEPLGVDLSDNQGYLDIYTMFARGVKFAYIRTGIGTSYIDKRFPEYWDALQAAHILVAPYHVLRPDQNAVAQVATLFGILGTRTLTMPPCWDLERRDGQTKEVITNKIYSVLGDTASRTGKPTLAYSARWFLDGFTIAAPWYTQYDWWLAAYLSANPLTGYAEEHPGPLIMPKGIDSSSVVIQQTAGQYKSAGFGVQSLEIDIDRWLQGGLASLYNWAGVTPPAPQPTVEQRLDGLTADVTDLKRRVANLEVK